MAAFVFEFEAVLEQRRRVEREAQVAVAALEGERLAIEDRIRGCQHGIERERRELSAHLSSAAEGQGVALDAVRMQANAGLTLVGRAQQEVYKLAGLHKKIDEARLVLLEATTRRRAIELLREQRFEAWKREQDRREASALDDLNVMRAGKAGGSAW